VPHASIRLSVRLRQALRLTRVLALPLHLHLHLPMCLNHPPLFVLLRVLLLLRRRQRRSVAQVFIQVLMRRRLLSIFLHRHRKLLLLALPSLRRIRSEQDADAASPHLKHRMGIAPFNEKKQIGFNQSTNQPTLSIDIEMRKTKEKLCKIKVV
jgi:hypothetical protein